MPKIETKFEVGQVLERQKNTNLKIDQICVSNNGITYGGTWGSTLSRWSAEENELIEQWGVKCES